MFKRFGNSVINLKGILYVKLEKNKIFLTSIKETSPNLKITSDTELEAEKIFENLVKELKAKEMFVEFSKRP